MHVFLKTFKGQLTAAFSDTPLLSLSTHVHPVSYTIQISLRNDASHQLIDVSRPDSSLTAVISSFLEMRNRSNS